jgi:hypothetical protein
VSSKANAKIFASTEQLGLEGTVSKRLGSHYRSGRVASWRKVECWSRSRDGRGGCHSSASGILIRMLPSTSPIS